MNVIDYWKNPDDKENSPSTYMTWAKRSEIAVRVFKKHVRTNQAITELWCNVGRNLNALYQAGYRSLVGVDINDTALRTGSIAYPALFGHASIYNMSIQDFLTERHDCDVLFTMAVLTHIPYDDNQIFSQISKQTSTKIILFEYQYTRNWKHFPRDYRKIFEEMGWKCIEFVSDLEEWDLKNVDLMVFEKQKNNEALERTWNKQRVLESY